MLAATWPPSLCYPLEAGEGVAPAEHEGTLRQVLTEAYQKIMGKDFLPIITEK